jgi:hypothetical protein
MNADRRAALQRKLAVAPVPKPPAGLAARIKNQIPKELRFSAERERARLAQSVRLSIAVAASVLVVIATAYLALDVTTRSKVDETGKPAASAPALRQTQTPRLQVPAPAAPPAPQVFAEKKTARTRTKKQDEKRAEAPAQSVAERSAVSFTPSAADAMAKAAPAAAAAPVAANAMKEEVTTSPISGKVMAREGKRVLNAASLQNVKLTAWKDTSRETKIEILKAELARGAEPGEVARVAREAGLDEFADSIEKKKQH